MSEVLLNEKEYKAMQYFITANSNKTTADLVEHWLENHHKWIHKLEPIKHLDLDMVIRCLYFGFDLEPTPEKKIKELHDQMKIRQNSEDVAIRKIGDVEMTTLLIILSILDIRIEGVND